MSGCRSLIFPLLPIFPRGTVNRPGQPGRREPVPEGRRLRDREGGQCRRDGP